MAAIRNVSKGRTTFIITHHLSTLLASDKIVYLSGGRIVETGTRDELLSRGGAFARAAAQGDLGFKL
jgi:subfamily B ATP-binding cassette protein MsbA